MNLDLLVGLNVVGIVSIIFLLYLTKTNFIFDSKLVKVFLLAGVFNLISIFFDILEYINEYQTYDNQKLVSVILIGICYITNPLLPYSLIFLMKKKDKVKIIATALLGFNTLVVLVLTIMNILTNYEFNKILHNTMVSIQLSISVTFFLTMCIGVFSRTDSLTTFEKYFLVIIMITVLGASVAEVLTHIRFLLWNYSALCLVLFFLYLHTQLLKYDVLTGLANRFFFEKTMNGKYDKKDIIAVVVFDINNLKITNDSLGHDMGDALIVDVAHSIKKVFTPGNCFRIGGDEFVFIGNVKSEIDVDQMIKKFLNTIGDDTTVAYGYSVSYDAEPLIKTFKLADNNMYLCKEKIKRKKSLEQR